MRILLLTNHLNPGGITTYVLSLAQGLKKKGHLVKIASRGGGCEQILEDSGIKHIYLNLHTKSELSPRIILGKRRLMDVLRTEAVDVLHAQTRITRVLSQFIQNRLRIPFVSTAHGFYKPRLGNRLFPCWGEGVVAISEAVKKDLIDKIKLNTSKIKVIYNGIDITRFNKNINDSDRNELRRNFGLGSGKVIVNISRLSFIKGHIYLIKAMEKVSQEHPDVSCLIIGEGEAENVLKTAVNRLGLAEKIKFYPSVSDTNKILLIADVFVLPTIQEGLGLAILEAMASGIPVVATNIGGIPEIIQNERNGLLVPVQDSQVLAGTIIRLLKDEPLRIRLVQNGRRTVKDKFSIKRMVGETEDFYRENINGFNK
jgi:glycosyltransferase involved in cell wall biosynthesis